MGKNKGKKKFNGGYSRSKDPMREVMRISSLINKIDLDRTVDDAVKKVNSANNKIMESTSVQVANSLLENKTVIKDIKDDGHRIATYVEQDAVQVVNKPFVIGYLKDYGGCGHFRMIYPMNLINSRFSFTGKLNCTLYPKMVVQDDIIPHVRSIVFQRPVGDMASHAIKAYKKFQPQYQYKLIGELDDFIFDIPDYNPMFDSNTIEEMRTAIVNLSLLDEIIVSTDTLRDELIKLGLDNKITVINNYLPKYLYQTDVKRFRFNNIVKPRIVYNGADSHYNNTKNMSGDFEGNIKDFIVKNVDKYEFIFFGNVPNFLKGAVDEGKVVVVPPTNPVEYATMLRKTRADFVIAPLVENVFNTCKSDLRYLEASSMGAVFIGSAFENGLKSPYQECRHTFTSSSTVEDIEQVIEKLCDKDLFNDELARQYDELDGRWLENNENIFKYVATYSTGVDGVLVDEGHPQYDQVKSFVKK